MANYADAVLNTAKYKVPELMNQAEFKAKPSTALLKYLKNTQFLIPATEMERALATKATDAQTVEVNLLNVQSISTTSSRAYNHTGSINDSRKITATFATEAAKFKYSIKGADRSIWQIGEQIAAQIRSAAIALHAAIETTLLARFNTFKSQVVVSLTPRSGAWDATNYIFQIPNTDFSYWMQKVKGFMREQYMTGQLEAVIDETLFQEFERIANQGAGNAENLVFQVGGVVPGVTEELTLDSGYVGQGYVFPVGTIGILPWIPSKNREGFGGSGENGGLYTTIPDPLGSGLTFAVHQYQTGVDNQSNAGERQDVDIEVELSIDLAPVEADTSTSNLFPMFKFGVQT